MDAEYGSAYATLYRRHWWWRAREEYLTRLLTRALRDVPEGDVLDFGCGDGLFFPVLERFGSVFGVEPDGALLDPHGPYRARISTERLTHDPAQHGRYRIALALDVLEHIAEPDPIVDELARRLKPGGLLLVTVPAFMALWTAHDVVNHHVKRYTVGEIEALIRRSGLTIVDARYFFGWLAPLKLALAAIERAMPRTPRPARIPTRPVNWAALLISRIELRLLESRHPPFGTSALILARRV